MAGLIQKPIYGKIAKKFGITQNVNSTLTLSDQVVPVLNADAIVSKNLIYTGTASASSTGVKTASVSVPAGKAWRIKALNMSSDSAGTMTEGTDPALFFRFRQNTNGYLFKLGTAGLSSVQSLSHILENDLILRSGDAVFGTQNVTGYTSGTRVYLIELAVEEWDEEL